MSACFTLRRYVPHARCGRGTTKVGKVARLATERLLHTAFKRGVAAVEDSGEQVVQQPRYVLWCAGFGDCLRKGLFRNPDELNLDANWYIQRGLNSLQMLSYLTTTAHITGSDKYLKVADKLIKEHSFLQNMLRQKFQRGIGTGNQSDDEMAFMCYYNYLTYETDPAIRSQIGMSMSLNWGTEYPEMNPFFNFATAATCMDITFSDAFGSHSAAFPMIGFATEASTGGLGGHDN